MLSDRLEILIPTYGRAPALRRTLERFAASPFARCRVTVVDNCSPDETPRVCAELAPRFAELRHVRNERNIGAPANVLRAVELSTAPYTWILADDDEWDLSRCDDVVAAVEAGDVDLISVGAPGRDGWAAGRTTLGALARAGAPVHYVFSFLPNTIFRTTAFDEDALREGYALLPTMYPQLAFLQRLLERDASVHVSEHELVRRGGDTVPGSELSWFVRWTRACTIVTDPGVRRREVRRPYPGPGWTAWLAAIILAERLEHPERVRGEVGSLLRALPAGLRAHGLLAAAVLVVPRPAALAARRIVRRVNPQSG